MINNNVIKTINRNSILMMNIKVLFVTFAMLAGINSSFGQEDCIKKHLSNAEKGNWNDMYLLGLCYYGGGLNNTSRNIDKAIYWLTKAEEKEPFSVIEFVLGICYEEGGVTTSKDLSKAFYWMKKAAEKDESDAQVNLARYYIKGIGVEKSFDQAMYWLNKAAADGNENAKKILAQFHEGDDSMKNSYIGKKVYWYEELSYKPDNGGGGSFLTTLTGIGIIKYTAKYTAIIESFIGDDNLKVIISKANIIDPQYASINYLKYKDIAIREINKSIGKTRVKDVNECEIE